MAKASEKAKCFTAFAEFIRLRDSDPNNMAECISCGKSVPYPNGNGDLNCGHYYPRSVVYAKLYFSEQNSHGQCVFCNLHLSGNVAEYRKGLIRRYGEEYVNELEDLKRMDTMTKLYDHDYKEMAKEYRKKSREIKKQRGIT